MEQRRRIYSSSSLPASSSKDAIYLRDDVTDEDAFRDAIDGPIFRIGEKGVQNAAHYQIHGAAGVRVFLLAYSVCVPKCITV